MSSDPPESDQDEVTGIHSVPSGMRDWARSQSRKTKKMEKHFEAGGMVYTLVLEWNAAKTWLKVLPVAVVVGAAAIGGMIWISQHSQPRAEDVAREVVRMQQQK